jgi:D-amino-acid dehydrogenase
MHICVLGAGVIGTTSAWRLLADGHQVTLVDALPEAGGGTSFGNGAQLSYSYVAPLADPSIWTHWAHYLFSPDSPLTLRPQADPAQWRWLLKFLAACTRERAQRTTLELLQLAFLSRDRLHQMLPALPFEFAFRRAGKLVMYDDPQALQDARRQVAFQAEYGCQQQVLDAARCLEIEPALAAGRRHWAGGVYTESEEVGDCGQFCRGLLELMLTDPQFRFAGSSPIGALDAAGGRLKSVRAGGAELQADAFVLALGADSPAFARQAGFALPIYPLKGYSITVPLQDPTPQSAPRVSITDISRKIVYARLDDRLRVAGRLELVGRSAAIPPRAVAELAQGVRELFPAHAGWPDSATLTPWAGFRPATPTGVPIISASPLKNLYLNVGHGALGWTLACGSAGLLADRIAGRTPAIDATPFLL